MKVEQFFDKGLAHISYAIVSDGEVALVDPARDPKLYYDFAKSTNAKIVAVIETHPHADFISSHQEISNYTGATIYTSKLAGVEYTHTPFDEGDKIKIGTCKLKALNTPGHSPDSISIVMEDENGSDYAVFTGDTLFIGDVGRPDLRENAGNITAKKEMLAKQMYHSLRDKLMKLNDEVIIYPAHGAGSLCGKNMSQELSGTMGQQKKENYALQEMSEEEFVNLLLDSPPTIPKYFPYDVELNRKGAPIFEESIKSVKRISSASELKQNGIIIDTRPEKEFKSGHLKDAVNIPNGGKFETWLGSIVHPDEHFYLVATDETALNDVIVKASKIGYELNIIAGLGQKYFSDQKEELLNVESFSKNTDAFTILDIRERIEVMEGKIFKDSINIPLAELRERKNEVPNGKPIVVHCAGGYRSAVGSSILSKAVSDKVFDLSEDVKKFQSEKGGK